MATANKFTKVITPGRLVRRVVLQPVVYEDTFEPPITEQRVILDLSLEEAQAVKDVFYRVGGHPSSRRGLIDKVTDALAEAGIQYGTGRKKKNGSSIDDMENFQLGSVTFI